MPALAADQRCWHCGEALPGPEPSGPRLTAADDERRARDSLVDLALYGGLTLAVIIAVVLVARALGAQPIVPPAPPTLPAGWSPLSGDGDYLLAYPPGWQAFEGPGLARAVAGRPAAARELEALLEIPGTLAGDLELVAVVLGPTGPAGETPMVVAARSVSLRRQAYRSLQRELAAHFPEISTTLLEGKAYRYLALAFEPGLEPGDRLCRLRIVHGYRVAFAVAACAQGAAFDSPENVLEAMLDGFYPEPPPAPTPLP
jgi:hypothetical protein